MVMFYVFIFLLNPFNIMHICHTWTTHIATKSWTPRVSRVLRIPRNARKSSSNRPSWPKISTVWVTQRHETFSLFIHTKYTSNKSKCKYKKHSRLWLQNWCPDTHTQTLAHTHTQYEKKPYPNRRQQASGRALSVCVLSHSLFLSLYSVFLYSRVGSSTQNPKTRTNVHCNPLETKSETLKEKVAALPYTFPPQSHPYRLVLL